MTEKESVPVPGTVLEAAPPHTHMYSYTVPTAWPYRNAFQPHTFQNLATDCCKMNGLSFLRSQFHLEKMDLLCTTKREKAKNKMFFNRFNKGKRSCMSLERKEKHV